ncbi:hypothetical protein J2P12_05155 [Candidatus Bathyarchaeota archaeon]|nr:hypothetical protein [Candidatus Bathyarchaeota archaeon]
MDRKVGLSTLWVFLMFNFLYADVIALFDFTFNGKGGAGSIQFTQGLLLGFSIELEIPMAMIILSRILSLRVNRWANIIVGAAFAAVTLLIQFIVPIVNGTTTSYYLFFGVIEIATTLFVVWYAWKWPKP